MKIYRDKIYITETEEPTALELMKSLLTFLPEWVNYIEWDASERKLKFSQERCRKTGALCGQLGDFIWAGPQLSEWETSFMYPVKRSKSVTKETEEHTEVFEDSEGERFRFVAATTNGKFVVQTLDGSRTLLKERLWEE